jgi:hypothetical protein
MLGASALLPRRRSEGCGPTSFAAIHPLRRWPAYSPMTLSRSRPPVCRSTLGRKKGWQEPNTHTEPPVRATGRGAARRRRRPRAGASRGKTARTCSRSSATTDGASAARRDQPPRASVRFYSRRGSSVRYSATWMPVSSSLSSATCSSDLPAHRIRPNGESSPRLRFARRTSGLARTCDYFQENGRRQEKALDFRPRAGLGYACT